MTDTPEELENNPLSHSDIHRLELGDRQIIVIGTAHISQESAKLVRQVIEAEKPDSVCVEHIPRAVASQQLQRRSNGSGRVAVHETLLVNASARASTKGDCR